VEGRTSQDGNHRLCPVISQVSFLSSDRLCEVGTALRTSLQSPTPEQVNLIDLYVYSIGGISVSSAIVTLV
jgi:hypothetical protein